MSGKEREKSEKWSIGRGEQRGMGRDQHLWGDYMGLCQLLCSLTPLIPTTALSSRLCTVTIPILQMRKLKSRKVN